MLREQFENVRRPLLIQDGSRYLLSVTPEQMKALAIMSYYVSGGDRENPTAMQSAIEFADTLEAGFESEERIALVRVTAQDIWESAVQANLEV